MVYIRINKSRSAVDAWSEAAEALTDLSQIRCLFPSTLLINNHKRENLWVLPYSERTA